MNQIRNFKAVFGLWAIEKAGQIVINPFRRTALLAENNSFITGKIVTHPV